MWAQQKYNSATASFQVRLFIGLFGRVRNHHIGGCMAKRAQVAEIDSKYLLHMHTITTTWHGFAADLSHGLLQQAFSLFYDTYEYIERNADQKLWKKLAPWLFNSTPLNGRGCLKTEIWWYMTLRSVHPRKCAQKGNLANLWFKPLQKHHI